MKVFISWSGELSKSVAEILKTWLKCVLQATEPWISTEDIEKGSLWFGEISQQLKETSVGIICLTRENLGARWILFEAGGLAKGLTQSRVCTFLIDVADRDVEPPLSHFNSTKPTKEDAFKLVQSINGFLGDRGLPLEILKRTFDQFWPGFEADFKKAVATPSVLTKTRTTDELIEEILEITRHNQRVLDEIKADIYPTSLLEALRGKSNVPRSIVDMLLEESQNPSETGLSAKELFSKLTGDTARTPDSPK